MTDIRTTWSPLLYAGDWLIDPPDLAGGADLETATLLSLFTDARAADDDRLPGSLDDRRGWWAAPLGSRLWLLSREVATNEVRLRAEDYCREALQWMLDDGVADQIDVAAEWAAPPDQRRLEIEVVIYRAGNIVFARRFDWAWNQQRQRALTTELTA
jgi:phage gp46-like protein